MQQSDTQLAMSLSSITPTHLRTFTDNSVSEGILIHLRYTHTCLLWRSKNTFRIISIQYKETNNCKFCWFLSLNNLQTEKASKLSRFLQVRQIHHSSS